MAGQTEAKCYRKTGRKIGNIRGDKGTGCEAMYGDLCWVSLESRIITKSVFAGKVASLESWVWQAWEMAEEKGKSENID